MAIHDDIFSENIELLYDHDLINMKRDDLYQVLKAAVQLGSLNEYKEEVLNMLDRQEIAEETWAYITNICNLISEVAGK